MTERVEGFAESVVQILEKLAGKESDLEFKFKDLVLEVAGLKTKLSGSMMLSIKYYREEKD